MSWGTDTRYVSVNLIITISCDLLSIRSEGPYCNENLFETQMFSFNKNALENVICQTTAISTRPYCVKLTPPLSYHQYVEVVNVVGVVVGRVKARAPERRTGTNHILCRHVHHTKVFGVRRAVTRLISDQRQSTFTHIKSDHAVGIQERRTFRAWLPVMAVIHGVIPE